MLRMQKLQKKKSLSEVRQLNYMLRIIDVTGISVPFNYKNTRVPNLSNE